MDIKSTISDLDQVVEEKKEKGREIPEGFTGASWGEMALLTLNHHFERFPVLQAWAEPHPIDGANTPWGKDAASAAASAKGREKGYKRKIFPGSAEISHTRGREGGKRQQKDSDARRRGEGGQRQEKYTDARRTPERCDPQRGWKRQLLQFEKMGTSPAGIEGLERRQRQGLWDSQILYPRTLRASVSRVCSERYPQAQRRRRSQVCNQVLQPLLHYVGERWEDMPRYGQDGLDGRDGRAYRQGDGGLYG